MTTACVLSYPTRRGARDRHSGSAQAQVPWTGYRFEGASPDERGKERRQNRACRRGSSGSGGATRPRLGADGRRSAEPAVLPPRALRDVQPSAGQSPCRELHEESPAIRNARSECPPSTAPPAGMSPPAKSGLARRSRQRRFLLRRVRVTPASPPPSSNSVAGSGTGAGLPDRSARIWVKSQLGTPKPLCSSREILAVPVPENAMGLLLGCTESRRSSMKGAVTVAGAFSTPGASQWLRIAGTHRTVHPVLRRRDR